MANQQATARKAAERQEIVTTTVGANIAANNTNMISSMPPKGVSKSGNASAQKAQDEAEAGLDNELAVGTGEDEVLIAEVAAEEGATAGLFGGLGVAAGVDVAATGGLAALGLASGLNTGSGDGAEGVITPSGPTLQVAGVNSTGLNLGPSANGAGAQGLNLGNTNVTVGGGKEPVATVNQLSLIDPSAPLPSGNPISIDPVTQQLDINLGPLGRISAGLSPESLSGDALNLVNGLTSGNLELEKVLMLDIPTSIAGMDIPVTDTLNDGLAQLGDALAPVTDALLGALTSGLPEGSSSPLEAIPVLGDVISEGPTALAGVPVLGDVVSQLAGSLPIDAVGGGLPTGALAGAGGEPIDNIPVLGPVLDQVTSLLGGASPIGDLPVGAGTQIPSTVPELDLVTNQVTSAINSAASGENPLAPVLSALPV